MYCVIIVEAGSVKDVYGPFKTKEKANEQMRIHLRNERDSDCESTVSVWEMGHSVRISTGSNTHRKGIVYQCG